MDNGVVAVENNITQGLEGKTSRYNTKPIRGRTCSFIRQYGVSCAALLLTVISS
jgi:hypothetical protein